MDNTDKLNKYIDNCISVYENHYDIAYFIYESLKDKYIYVEKDNKWLYMNKTDINNLNRLKTEIKSNIVSQIIIRSLYWNENDKDEIKIRSLLLLKLANNLKKDKFLRAIIKEIKQFY